MSVLDILILLPIVAAAMILLGGPARQLALGTGILNAILGTAVFFLYDRGEPGYQFTASRTVLESPNISYAVGVDGLGVILVFLSVLVLLVAVWQIPQKLEGRSDIYCVSILLIGAGSIGAFASTDLFFFYAFHELALIPTFLMIGMFGHGPDRTTVAWRITGAPRGATWAKAASTAQRATSSQGTMSIRAEGVAAMVRSCPTPIPVTTLAKAALLSIHPGKG